jgi:uncharacterized membrane protein
MQNPPPTQQNFGTPPSPSAPGRSPLGSMDPKVAGALSYIWIVGLVFFILEKENRFVRFHALQSLLFGVANSVIMVVLVIVASILTLVFSIGAAAIASGGGTGLASLVGYLVWLIWLVFWLIGLLMFGGLIFAAVKAYQGETFKLPIIGKMAEKIVNK